MADCYINMENTIQCYSGEATVINRRDFNGNAPSWRALSCPLSQCPTSSLKEPRPKRKKSRRLAGYKVGEEEVCRWWSSSGQMEDLSDAIRGILTAWTLIIEFHQKVRNFSEHQRVIYFQRVGVAQTNPMSPLQVNLEPAMPQSVSINLRQADLSVYLRSH